MRRLSIIVPVRDHATELECCLWAIGDSARGRREVEVLVVDAGSRDGSAEVARRAGVTVVRAGGVTAAGARNAGARAAAGELLAFVDADIVICADWIDVALTVFEDPWLAAAGTRPFAPPDGNWVQRAVDLMRSHPESRRPVRWLGAGNWVLRRRAFEQAGGFDSALETCEDVDLSLRLRRGGFRLIDEPGLACVHLGDPRTLRGVFLSELWRGRDNLRVSLRPADLRDRISGIVPVLELAALGACLAPAARIRRSAAAFLASMVALRALRMAGSGDSPRWRALPGALPVAGVYELARALAIAFPAPYLLRRRARS